MSRFFKWKVRKLSYKRLRELSPSFASFVHFALIKFLHLPFAFLYDSRGIMDEIDEIPEEDAPRQLVDEVRNAIRTQPEYCFHSIAFYRPPALHPAHRLFSAALLSQDGYMGLLVVWHRLESSEQFAYSCTTDLGTGSYLITHSHKSTHEDTPPNWTVSSADQPTFSATLACHKAAIAGQICKPFSAENVTRIVLELSREYFDYNLRRGHLVAMTGKEVRDFRERFAA